VKESPVHLICTALEKEGSFPQTPPPPVHASDKSVHERLMKIFFVPPPPLLPMVAPL
jgi:hypothetical protein